MTDTKFWTTTRALFNLREDTDEEATSESVRKNVDFRSGNAWTLVFAIFIASVGLNTNSAAVIIGAMLISPLMGPIVGAGFALGINDFHLLYRSCRNLMQAMAISIATSMLYFLVSPLSQAQSELLARTSPTFYDVMIAAFGGAAGIVAISRKEKNNAIPGVAIATALMPPLCTAGYALTNGEWRFFAGALYLFIINSVFICISTYVFVRYMHFHRATYPEPGRQKRVDRWIMLTAIAVILPSLVLAWFLQRESSFRSRAASFVERELVFPHTLVVEKKISYSWGDESLQVGLLGEKLTKGQMAILKAKMGTYDINPSSVTFKQYSPEEQVEKRLENRLRDRDTAISKYENKILALEMEGKQHLQERELSVGVNSELKLLFPGVDSMVLDARENDQAAHLHWTTPPGRLTRAKVDSFLKQRLGNEKLQIKHFRKI